VSCCQCFYGGWQAIVASGTVWRPPRPVSGDHQVSIEYGICCLRHESSRGRRNSRKPRMGGDSLGSASPAARARRVRPAALRRASRSRSASTRRGCATCGDREDSAHARLRADGLVGTGTEPHGDPDASKTGLSRLVREGRFDVASRGRGGQRDIQVFQNEVGWSVATPAHFLPSAADPPRGPRPRC